MLRYNRATHTVDAHTGGELLWIFISGLSLVPGATILERRAELTHYHDDIRQFLINGSRGHADMYGAYLLPVVMPEADFGAIFIHNENYSDIC